MAEYQPSFRKIELNRNGIQGNNNNNILSKMSASSIQNLNQSTTEFPTNQILSSNHNNAFGMYQQSKYDINNGTSFMQDPSTKGDLFENQIPIKIRQPGKEDAQTILNLKIFTSNKGTSQSQVLRLELTDETNFLFLYLMELSESEFLHVKKEQNLHVDFFSFPSQFAERIELCISQESENKVQFFCMLDIKNNNEADFNIVEMNHFKSSTHLSLKLRQANDEILKNFLAKKLSVQKCENEQLRIQNSRLDEELNCRNMDIRINTDELKRLQDEKKRTIEEIKLEEQRKFQKAQEEYIQKEERIRRQYETNKLEFDQKYRGDIESYQEKYEKSLSKCQNLSERLIELEAQLKEFQSKTTSLDKESNLNRKQVEELKAENRELSKIRFEQEKKITELSFVNKGMTKQIEDKENLLENNKDLADNFNSQKDMLKQQCDEYRTQIQKLEQKLDLCTEEINKGNKIIEKLQEELSKQKNKIKTKNQIVIKQESFLEEIKSKNDELSNELLKKEREINNKDLKIKEQDNQINDYKEKIVESQKMIENNQSMIQYLNKQMNEGGVKSSTISTSTKPLSSYQQYSSYENKYSATNYNATSGISRKYSQLDLNQENQQPNINGATTPYSQQKEGNSYGNNNNNTYGNTLNRPSYTSGGYMKTSNLLSNTQSISTQQDQSPLGKADQTYTNKYSNYSSGNNNFSSAINNNYSNNNNLQNTINNTPNISKQYSNSNNNNNNNNQSDLISYNPNNTNNNITQTFSQSGQSQSGQSQIQLKYGLNSKEEEHADDQDFSSKYLFNDNKNNNVNKNFDDDAPEEPQRVTPIKYRQPKNPK